MFGKEFSFDVYHVPNIGWHYSHNSLLARPSDRFVRKHLRILEKKGNILPEDPLRSAFCRVIVRRSLARHSYIVMPCRWECWADSTMDPR